MLELPDKLKNFIYYMCKNAQEKKSSSKER